LTDAVRAAPARRAKPQEGRSRERATIRAATAAAALIPLAVLLWDAATGDLGVEPIETITHRTGWWGLTLLMATLSVTPIRRLTGWNRLIQARKPLGLVAFSYVCLHFLTYIVLDQWFGWSYIVEDIVERPFITVGFTAFVLLIPLAATSTARAIRRLGGKRWKRIHQLIYPAAVLAVLHFLWLVKADTREPLLFGGVLVVLLAMRIPAIAGALRK
jgi:methionine sulfoxide reductase heme-binding subunit